MGLGINYADQHQQSAQFIRNELKWSNLDEISWTSDPTPWNGDAKLVQNCFAYAMGSVKYWQPPSVIWGDPEGDPRHYWPEELCEDTEANLWVARYVEAAKTKGFSECTDGSFEVEYEKIVLVHKGGIFAHAAIQIGENRWKSKLGVLSDLEHPFKLVMVYGKGTVFMKRSRPTSQQTSTGVPVLPEAGPASVAKSDAV